MSMDIIGAGMGRTGTLSLKHALERLGFDPCYHMTTLLEHPEHASTWAAAARGEQVDWNTALGSFRATVDHPGCNFYKDLMAKYPEAKVILSVRDPGKWYDSARETIYRASRAAIAAGAREGAPEIMRVANSLVWEKQFDGRFEDREYAISVFEQHNEEVKRTVPAERLLVFEARQGWEPLCAFLGVDVPDEPYPRVNSREEFKKMIAEMEGEA
ncbi:sulfotransferase family protein [Haliangium ochraceum]|uniref:Sulfotransferase n=1 Tax=Haliangium ochraceum (strain DSM 14365 / JCM 11303 / SMP-2) TaxID=502025 RepID=D0LL77_HALO1|nr:sulfotransferase family protein [Haliangium ochraceum]ACY18573.1 conserved hypothetical protein [Haliangium ochraceum DSM 14365]